ncbi:YdaS family helix-turn-helix protein [Bosea sp. UC22_33]|uniref:YdaS family helix-turn-helix protein n=1 Tax=Bosea sp. UC22_33 TaxID=3350165 RepID=UPI00366E822B
MSIDLAAELVRRGVTQSALAKDLNIHKSAVTRWTKWRMPIPVSRVADVERITGISRHDLRPDVFGAKPEERAA